MISGHTFFFRPLFKERPKIAKMHFWTINWIHLIIQNLTRKEVIEFTNFIQKKCNSKVPSFSTFHELWVERRVFFWMCCQRTYYWKQQNFKNAKVSFKTFSKTLDRDFTHFTKGRLNILTIPILYISSELGCCLIWLNKVWNRIFRGINYLLNTKGNWFHEKSPWWNFARVHNEN